MSVSTIITRGYGIFAGIQFIAVRGYLASNAPIGPGFMKYHVKRGQAGHAAKGRLGTGGLAGQ